jgi:hypothetical protein
MRAGGVNERLKGERKARVDGDTSIGGGFRWIGWSSHILDRGCTRQSLEIKRSRFPEKDRHEGYDVMEPAFN